MNMTHNESPSEQLIDALDELGDSLNKINDDSELDLNMVHEVEKGIDNHYVDPEDVPESSLLVTLKRSLGMK